jgi:hypothetical protein
VAKIMREISYYSQGHVTIQDSKGANILLRLAKLENAEIKSDVSVALLNLSTCMFVTQLIDDGVVEAVFWLTLQDLLGLTKTVMERCSAIIRNLCTNEKGINRIVLENKLMVVLKKMAAESHDLGIKYNVCISLCVRARVNTKPAALGSNLTRSHAGTTSPATRTPRSSSLGTASSPRSLGSQRRATPACAASRAQRCTSSARTFSRTPRSSPFS